MTKAEVEFLKERLEQAEKRIEALEQKVYFVAPLPEPEPEPEPVIKVFCRGVPRKGPDSFGRPVLKTAIYSNGEVQVPELTTDRQINQAELAVHGGRENDVTDADPTALQALLEAGAHFMVRTYIGGGYTSETIETVEQLDAALDRAKEGAAA